MSTMDVERESNQILEALQEDLPSLACDAAIELDNLRRGHSTQLRAIRQLAAKVQNSMTEIQDAASPSSLFNPTAAVVMSGAISDSQGTQPIRGLDELMGATRKVKDQLDKLLKTSPPSSVDAVELREIQGFCLALSKRASSLSHPRHREEPQHPFRR